MRIPLALFDVDAHQGDAELVLNRREARSLLERLAVVASAAPAATESA
ncbi:hypothetical protein [Streptomyces sp. NBC_00091]|nr:hypothetical protein [Streptomyces sp. NBC_00091]MCX5381370.1 hypothetical protein [Streptomyces sp. NBC_00091]